MNSSTEQITKEPTKQPNNQTTKNQPNNKKTFAFPLHALLMPVGKSRNSELRFASLHVLGQAKQNKFCGPLAREKQIKNEFLFVFPLAYS